MRFPREALVTVLLLTVPVSAPGEPYGWAISGSSTDPFVQTGSPLPEPGLLSLWLWLVCHENDGVAAAEFDVAVTGDLLFLTLPTQWPTAVNLGSGSTLILGISGCPVPPYLVGQLQMLDLGAGGTVCLVPSAANGRNVSVDCGFPQPTAFPNAVLGWSSDGSPPCEIGNCVDPATPAPEPALERRTWGRIKGTYR